MRYNKIFPGEQMLEYIGPVPNNNCVINRQKPFWTVFGRDKSVSVKCDANRNVIVQLFELILAIVTYCRVTTPFDAFFNVSRLRHRSETSNPNTLSHKFHLRWRGAVTQRWPIWSPPGRTPTRALGRASGCRRPRGTSPRHGSGEYQSPQSGARLCAPRDRRTWDTLAPLGIVVLGSSPRSAAKEVRTARPREPGNPRLGTVAWFING